METYNEINGVVYVEHEPDEKLNGKEKLNLLGTRKVRDYIPRWEHDVKKMNELLSELNKLKCGDIEQFPKHGRYGEGGYVKIMVADEGHIWIPEVRFSEFVRAAELKCIWWWEWKGKNLEIHRIKVQYTNREKAILETFFSETCDGQISTKNNNLLNVCHKAVVYKMVGVNMPYLYCSAMDCKVVCYVTGALWPLRIGMGLNKEGIEDHAKHNTTALPASFVVYSRKDFEDAITKNPTPSINKYDNLPTCQINPDGSIWFNGKNFFKRRKTATCNSYRSMSKPSSCGTMHRNSKGEPVFAVAKKTIIDINDLPTIDVVDDTKIAFDGHTFKKTWISTTQVWQWQCHDMHRAGVKVCQIVGQLHYNSKNEAKFFISSGINAMCLQVVGSVKQNSPIKPVDSTASKAIMKPLKPQTENITKYLKSSLNIDDSAPGSRSNRKRSFSNNESQIQTQPAAKKKIVSKEDSSDDEGDFEENSDGELPPNRETASRRAAATKKTNYKEQISSDALDNNKDDDDDDRDDDDDNDSDFKI